MSNLKDFLVKEISNFLNSSGKEFRHMKPEELIMCLKFPDDYYHYILPDDKKTRNNFMKELSNVIKVDDDQDFVNVDVMEPIIFRNKQAVGDTLLFTCAIRDLKARYPNWPVNVDSTTMHIWDNNPYLDKKVNKGTARIVKVGPSYLVNKSNIDDRHFTNAFRISIQDRLGIKFPQGPIYPDIWMTKDEVNSEPLVERPYWIITAGEKGDWTAKGYPYKWWQEVVNMLPDIKFVQIGSKKHQHKPLKGDNVINFIGKTEDPNTGIRDLFKLFYFAEGSVGLLSFQMHLSAAFNLPCIVVAGAREPIRLNQYSGQRHLSLDGCLPCVEQKACWVCNTEKACRNKTHVDGIGTIPKCMELIKPTDIVNAIEQYYVGGRLSRDIPRKPFMYNEPVNPDKYAITEKISNENIQDYGLEWGGKFITQSDYDFILNIIKKDSIKTILDIGSGIHTILLSKIVDKIDVLEADKNNRKRVEKYLPDNVRMINWDKQDIDLEKYDLVFVDGPPGGKNREISFKIAAKCSDNVIVHDESREWETKFQNKYLSKDYKLMTKGGKRCAYWKLRSSIKIEENDNKNFLMLFNGRGDGGAEHSVMYICDEMLKKGYNVDYFTPKDSPCGTFRREGNYDINLITKDFTKLLRKKYDISLLYVNDWIWEFKKDIMKEFIPQINVDKRIMAINYRLGEIGNLEWTRGWDKYIFLNSTIEKDLLSRSLENTVVLAPPLRPENFINATINSEDDKFIIVRHSSQGDTKYAKNFEGMVDRIMEEFPNSELHLMPRPTFLNYKKYKGRVKVYKRNEIPIWDFLSQGNCFWYSLPEGYKDMGPKVIMEAQLVGLPVIAEKHTGGADDRVDDEFLYEQGDMDGMIEKFKLLEDRNTRNLESKRIKEYAKLTYDPKNWIKEIVN